MRVVLLLIDGLGYSYLPHDSFWKSHSHPIQNAKPTITLPNWLTILSGQLPSQHQVLTNEVFRQPSARFEGSTLFDDAASSVMISDWAMMHKISPRPAFLFGNIWRQTQALPHAQLLVLNYQRLDTIGHARGWGSAAYMKTLRYVDRQTQRLYERLVKTQEPFVMIGVADHGGLGEDHEDHTSRKTTTVPLLFVNHSDQTISPKTVQHTRQIRSFVNSIWHTSTKKAAKK